MVVLLLLGCHHTYANPKLDASDTETPKTSNLPTEEKQPILVTPKDPIVSQPLTSDHSKSKNAANKTDGAEKPLLIVDSLADDQPSSISNIEFNQKNTAITLHPYIAHYDILDGQKIIGTAQRSLKREGDYWRLEMSTGTDRWYYEYHYVESSLFKLQDGLPLPIEYSSVTERSFKKDKKIKSYFDWSKKIEIGNQNGKHWSLPLSNPVYDHLNYQLALQLKAANNHRKERLRVSYKGKLELYQFVNEGRDTVTTPLGTFSTLVWSEVVENSDDKYIVLWLAPDLNYLPVQMVRYNKGKQEGIIQLRHLEMEK
jgi:hypothetical protein